MNSVQLVNAFEFSSLKHQHQKRSGKYEFPYFSHIASVATLLAKYDYSDEVIIAGILHDTLEDTETTYDELVLNFGKQVADLVQHVTEDTTISLKEMKIGYVDHLKQEATPHEASAISCADLIANCSSMMLEEEHTPGFIARLYGELFSDFKKLTTYRRDVIAGRLGSDASIVVELDKVLEKIFSLV